MSSEDQTTTPSTLKQFDLARLLEKELQELGLIDIKLSEHCILTATLPSNCESNEVVGFIAHLDTIPGFSGTNVNPNVVYNYDGSTIELKNNIKLSPSQFPFMNDLIGKTLITTDGTTVLGADDKAGVAEIMSAVEYIMEHPEFKHGEIKIGFTPDEEIGRGVVKFDVEKFGAKYAYTMDGGAIGELEYENFNAAGATVQIQGCNIHPGYAKDKMINAMHVGMEFNSLLPAEQRPEHTCGYEGFFHLIEFTGTVENAKLSYIIRDHDLELFEGRKELMVKCAEKINEKYGCGTVNLDIKHQYYNMKQMVEPHLHIVDKAMEAMKMEGIEPKVQPIRGGTDGANLSYMGLPCPNIFAGGHNFHGKFEYIPLESMEKASKVVLNIISLYAK
jgi:tripeptide aminopeptidase